jgi:hypothetical protein
MKTNYLSAPVPALNPSPAAIAAWDGRSPAISQKETKRTKVRGVGFAFLLAAFLGSCATTELRAQVVVVPNSLATNDGNVSSTSVSGKVIGPYAGCRFMMPLSPGLSTVIFSGYSQKTWPKIAPNWQK